MHWRHILVLVLVVAATSLLGRVLSSAHGVTSSPGDSPPRVGVVKKPAPVRVPRNWTSMDVDGIRLGMTRREVPRPLQNRCTCSPADPVVCSESHFSPLWHTCVMFRDRRVAWVAGHELHVRHGKTRVTVHHGSSQADVLRALGPADRRDESTWHYRPASPGAPSLEVEVVEGLVESLSLHVN